MNTINIDSSLMYQRINFICQRMQLELSEYSLNVLNIMSKFNQLSVAAVIE